MAFTALLLAIFAAQTPESPEALRERSAYLRMVQEGSQLTAFQASELERRVESGSGFLEDRIRLLGFYRNARDAASLERRAAHALWLIENHPDNPVAGTPDAGFSGPLSRSPGVFEARELWLRHVENRRHDAAVLANAASFFATVDKALHQQLLEEGAALRPADPYWSVELGRHFMRERIMGDRLANSTKALEAFEHAYAITAVGRERLSREMAEAAFEAELWDKARLYATAAASAADNDSVHDGNWILGQLALREGDVERAKAFLLESVRNGGSPVLNSFGPRLSLARKLLETGERQAVIDYFEQCLTFWNSGRHDLQQWIAVVRNDGMPSFGNRGR